MRPLAALLLLVPLAFAGCIDAATDAGVTDPPTPAGGSALAYEAVRALLADVPCEVDAVGKGTSENLLTLGALQVEEGPFGELDVRGDLLLAARLQGGLYVFDVADPQAPSLLSTYAIEDTYGAEVKWLPDGSGALVGDFGRIHVIDLADPANPVEVSTFEYADEGVSGQSHMLHVWDDAEGKRWVFVATQTTRQPLLVLSMDGWNLTLEGTYGLPAVQSLPLGNHDMLVVHDEILDAPVLYVADGLAGWSAASLADPAKPQRIGGTLSLEPGVGYTHTVRVGFFEGKRIVVTIAEVGLNTLKVYDATNLHAPVLLARWSADAARPHIPQHNIQLVGDKLVMGHYTEGVFVFNMTDVAKAPPLLGTLEMAPMAHWAVEEPAQPGALGFANVWDVSVSKGILLVSDTSHGTLTTIGFGCFAAGDDALTATQ